MEDRIGQVWALTDYDEEGFWMICVVVNSHVWQNPHFRDDGSKYPPKTYWETITLFSTYSSIGKRSDFDEDSFARGVDGYDNYYTRIV